jgi:hypothetical protein
VIDPQTPRDTRVIVNNQGDPFYLAAGVVTGPKSETHIKVRFDMRPGLTYEVPVADLNRFQAGSTFYQDLRQGETRTISGVPSLVRFFREHETENGKWALTGSSALAVWAHHYGVEFRWPKDIDVVVAKLNAWYFDLGLAATGSPGAPTVSANHRTVDLGMFTLDILAAGEGLGEFGDGLWTMDGAPVVGLGIIKKYKLLRDNEQDRADIKVLDTVLAKVTAKRQT